MSLVLAQPTHISRRRGSTKAKHRKARTGCNRCKSRRVKCDESKPACQRCRSMGMECPGYSVPKPRIFGLSQNDCFTSDFDKLCFDSFLADGIHYLLGYQPSSRDFWLRIVPQLSEIHAPVRHTVIALGSMQEAIRRPNVNQVMQITKDDAKATMLHHFNTAIRDFIECSPSMSIQAKLACCILFTAVTMRAEYSTAVAIHVKAADKLISQYEYEVANGSHMVEPVIVHEFKPLCQRLLIEAATFTDDYKDRTLSRSRPYEEFSSYFFNTAIDFHDCASAWEYVSILLKYAIAIHFGDIEHRSTLAHQVRMALSDLAMNIELVYSRRKSCKYSHRESKYDSQCMKHTLMLNCLAIQILAETKSSDEDGYDYFTKDFERMLDLGEQIVSMERSQLHPTIGIIPALFLTATKCRVPRLRYKALQLLHESKRFERTWSSCTAFQIAHFLIKEENRSQSYADILNLERPDRVSLRSVKLHRNTKSATVVYEICCANGKRVPASFNLSHEYVLSGEDSSGLGFVTDRIVQAAGFSGTNLRTPTISCHCTQTCNEP